MNRALFLFGLMLVSSAAFAMNFDAATFFQPPESDLSAWYLANIFGADLVPGAKSSGVRLLSVLFGIFNQVVLSVGIIIIIYTAMAGTLNTASEGKALGEKWNSMWLPVRVSLGIALLVPKGGSGYCLAQSMVMWLTLQGIGAGGQVWVAMLEYFEQGGAIYSGETSRATTYMTEKNINYTYVLQGATNFASKPMPDQGSITDVDLLKLMVCNELFNTSDAAQGDKYEAYTIGQTDRYDKVFFGNRKCGTDTDCYGKKSSSGVGGYECGMVISEPLDDSCLEEDCEIVQQQIYSIANWNLAQGLKPLAEELVKYPDFTDPESRSEEFYPLINRGSELYINYLVGYENLLSNPAKNKGARNFNTFKKYGWILAGNYYTILSGLKEDKEMMNRAFHPAKEIKFDGNALPTPVAGDAYDAASTFMVQFAGSDLVYDIPGYQQGIARARGFNSNSRTVIGLVDMNEIYKALGAPTKKQKAAKKGAATVATRFAVTNFLNYLTGEEGSLYDDLRVSKDPIMRAANYGKSLQISAMIILPIFTSLYLLAAVAKVCDGIVPAGSMVESAMTVVAVPLFALFIFMYTQGAILGVFIPLIPYVTFFIGAVGWILQVVEAVAAAPLVAIGLVFPETKDDIWGKAEPAKMLILSLFLRPSLMIIGLAAAMMVMWVSTELLNIGFLMLTTVTFRTEDAFGFVTIVMAYTALFIVLVTKVYALINNVPNKVLAWIGGHGMEVEGAGEALGAAKSGVEAGGKAVGSGLQSSQETSKAALEAHKKYKAEQKDKSIASGGGASTKPD